MRSPAKASPGLVRHWLGLAVFVFVALATSACKTVVSTHVLSDGSVIPSVRLVGEAATGETAAKVAALITEVTGVEAKTSTGDHSYTVTASESIDPVAITSISGYTGVRAVQIGSESVIIATVQPTELINAEADATATPSGLQTATENTVIEITVDAGGDVTYTGDTTDNVTVDGSTIHMSWTLAQMPQTGLYTFTVARADHSWLVAVAGAVIAAGLIIGVRRRH